MRNRLRPWLADRRLQVAADSLLAAAILISSLVEIEAGTKEWSGPRALELGLAAVCAVPLVLRRSRPVAVTAVVVAAALAIGVLAAPTQGPFEPFVAVVFAVYSLGVHAAGRRGAIMIGACTLAGVATWASTSHYVVGGADYGDWFPTLVWAWGAWGVGRIIQANGRRTRELARLAAELAVERDIRAGEAVTIERARIARELHDVVAHNISVMGVQATAARRVLEGEQPAVRRALEAIETTGRETIDEMRHMLGVLREHTDELTLAPQPGLGNLNALAAQLRTAGLPVEIRVEGAPRSLPAGLDLSAYRIVQEALTNALKHGAPAHASVAVRYLDGAVELEIVDDGGGEATAQGTGNGLIGMRERVAMFGGELHAGRRAEGGWLLRARLPLGTL